VSPSSLHPILGERLSIFQSQSLPGYIWSRIDVFKEFASQLSAIWVIVHAYDSRIIEEPEVLRGQTWVGLLGEIEDAHVLPASMVRQ